MRERKAEVTGFVNEIREHGREDGERLRGWLTVSAGCDTAKKGFYDAGCARGERFEGDRV